MSSMRTLLGSAVLVLVVGACNYTVGECYPRGEADGSADVSVGVGPGGVGGSGATPGGGTGANACNAAPDSPSDEGTSTPSAAPQRLHGARHVCPMPWPGLDHLRIAVPRHWRTVFGARHEPAGAGFRCGTAQAVPGELSRFDLHLLLQQWDELHANQRVWGVDPLVVHLHRREGMRVAVIAPHRGSS